MGRRLIWAAVLAIGLAAGCKKKPASGPDLSTPRAAAVTFISALERGDAETAKLACSAGGIEQDLIEAMALSASSLKRLYASATAKFGDDAKRLVPVAGTANLSGNLIDGNVDQNDEQATIHSKDGRDSLQLKRVDGLWKVDVGVLIRGQDISLFVPILRATGLAARKVADDIDSGKCTSIDDARRRMSQQIAAGLSKLMREQVAPATTRAAMPTTLDSIDASPQ